ncbi:MAG: bestrophin family ion channel [Microthrixaceae bacterium]
MIVKRNLSPRRVLEYTAGPMAWATLWAVTAPIAFTVTDDTRLIVPYPVIATLGAALAIFVAFRNNSAFARWNEARAAWQTVLVASRTLTRQVLASTRAAVTAGAITEADAAAFRRSVIDQLIGFAWALAAATRPGRPTPGDRSVHGRPEAVLVDLATTIKDGIRTGALGQFDPISTEPQLVALNTAQGTIERIATTPTLRQYDYFTRRLIELFALVTPFAIVGLVPDAIWLAAPLSLLLAGTFIVLAVTGAANDEPFANTVTDVPIDAICTQIEHDLLSAVGDTDPPPLLAPVDGYLW